MNQKSPSILNIHNLSVHFAHHRILKDINISFPEKTITVLIGRSGSGKTTFLRSINRLNEEFDGCRMTGRIDLDIGYGLQSAYDHTQKSEIPIQKLRQQVGMLFQTPQILPISLYRNIAMPLQLIKNVPSKEIKSRVEEILQRIGLWEEVKDRLNLPADLLSGGQQQRLCFARTLALEPTILLLDEPTSSLDVKATQQIEDLLLQLKKRYTLIMVSHNLEQAERLADTLVTFDKGEIISHK